MIRIAIESTSPIVRQADGVVADPWIFTSGLLADDGVFGLAPEATKPLGYPFFESEIKLQTRYILKKAQTILSQAGASLADVVKAHAFLTHPTDFVPLDEAWGEFFPHNVSRTFVATPQLPVKGARISIDLIACLPGRVEIIRRNSGASPAFSRKVEATRVGNVIFTSGQLGYDSRWGFVPESKQDRADPGSGTNLSRQAKLTAANLIKSLESVGGSAARIARAQLFLTDMADFARFKRDWRGVIDAPVAQTIVGSGLFVPEALLEVELTGYAEGARTNVGTVNGRNEAEFFRVGDLVFASGQLSEDAEGLVPLSTLPHPTFPNYSSAIKLQTRFVLTALVQAFERAGVDIEKIAKATVFLTDLDHYPGMNEVWGEFFPNPPARTVLQVHSLGVRDALIAVDAIGVV